MPRADDVELPSQIRVLGHGWDLEVDDESMDDQDAFGKTQPRTRSVILHSAAEQPVTLIHELIHVAEVAQYEGEKELDEEDVHVLARGLTAILSDNPELLDYIASKLTPPRRARAG